MAWDKRNFLFLQGPNGPFFRELSHRLSQAGHGVRAIAFNAGDELDWRSAGPLHRYTGEQDAYRDWIETLILEQDVTDIVLYGDTRVFHRQAIEAAQDCGATVHCFEEGYMRPYWITYERNGVNGNSRLMELEVAEMMAALTEEDSPLPDAPAHWGAAWHHAYRGFRYHFEVLTGNRRYPKQTPHRPTSLMRELMFYAKRLTLLPMLIPERRWRESRLRASGKIYHLVLLQLAADSSMRAHSRYATVSAFIEECLDAFVQGAKPHHHIVFKTHPFEDGRERLERMTYMLARDLGVADRVVFLHGGKLGRLLDRARSVVTINSTAAQQALWRGLPVRAMGEAVYDKPEFLSGQDLPAFFRHPKRPEVRAYREYRRFLLATSQIKGGFYAAAGRAQAINGVLDVMLQRHDPYDRLLNRLTAEETPALGDHKIAFLPRRAHG